MSAISPPVEVSGGECTSVEISMAAYFDIWWDYIY